MAFAFTLCFPARRLHYEKCKERFVFTVGKLLIAHIPEVEWRWHGLCYVMSIMKLIIAYIQPERLNAVKQALCSREIYKMSVTNALGCGRQGGYVQMYRGATEEVTLHKKMRLAIGVNDDYVEKTIEAIVEGARTGDIGDGKIFVLPMEECVRIRTGERGPEAIG